MSSKSFIELMKERHSARAFLSKPIPEDILKDIISTSLLTPSWGNSQPWNIYVASGNTLGEIRKEWIAKNKEGVKGYSDLNAGHRTDFSERSQNNINKVVKEYGELLKDPESKELWKANAVLFNAPTLVYITVPKKRTDFCIFDCGAIEMSIMLAAKDKDIDSVPAYGAIKYPDILRKHMKIPEDEDILIGIALGYEDKDNILSKYKSTKLSLEEVCHFYK